MKDYTFIGTFGARYRRTPMIVGLTLALCSPFSSFIYADDAVNGIAAIRVTEQARKVTGTIVDETGEPLIGVSVLVKGTSTGTITDFEGRFSIDLPAGKKELVISYIGYKEQTLTVGTNAQLNLKMVPDTQALDEVVVIGYGTVKKRDLTGAVVSVKSDDILKTPTPNAMEALQGKIAGMDITRSSGKAGADVKMSLRGNRSINGSNEPLFIIDGLSGSYNDLNPSDIESIEVLKDASSTAIYGSAGANGVVIVTTKKGKGKANGKPVVNFDAYVGFTGKVDYPHGYTGQDYINLRNDIAAANGNSVVFTPEEQTMIDNNNWVDWVDLATQTGINQNYNASVSSNGEWTKTFFSLGYNTEEGIIKDDKVNKYTMRLNIDQKINNWINTGVTSQLTYRDADNRNDGVFQRALVASPLGIPYNEDGSLNKYPFSEAGTLSPLADEFDYAYTDRVNNTRVAANGYLELKPVKGLVFKSVVGVNLNYRRAGKAFSNNSLSGQSKGDSNAEYNTSRSYGYKWENILNYNYTLNEVHDFGFTGVTSWSLSQNEEGNMSRTGLPVDKLGWYNMYALSGTPIVGTGYTKSQGMSYIARINYGYKGRYLLSASGRWDGTSRFVGDNRWDFFPAASAAWRISDEAFMESTQNWLSNLKLRVGYGVTGNSGTSDLYPTQSIVQYLTDVNLGGSSSESRLVYNQLLGNTALTWEKSRSYNIGLDVSLFNGRIDLAAELYNTKTDDILYDRTLPSQMGGSNGSNFLMTQNICKTENKGFELSLNTRNIQTKDFTWSSTVTFTTNKEKVTSLVDKDELIDADKNKILKVGEAIDSYYHYETNGVWQKGDEELAAFFGKVPGQIRIMTNIEREGLLQKDNEGYYYMKDDEKQRKYVYGPTDKTNVGSSVPSCIIGFNNMFTYKNFDLSVFFFARFGQTIKHDIYGTFMTSGSGNGPSSFNYWTEDNPTNDFPAVGYGQFTDTNYLGAGGWKYIDGSYIKLRNLTLGYTVPEKLLSKVGISKLRIYATATNPFIWTKDSRLDGYDPEANGAAYPMTKNYVFGVNLTF